MNYFFTRSGLSLKTHRGSRSRRVAGGYTRLALEALERRELFSLFGGGPLALPTLSGSTATSESLAQYGAARSCFTSPESLPWTDSLREGASVIAQIRTASGGADQNPVFPLSVCLLAAEVHGEQVSVAETAGGEVLPAEVAKTSGEISDFVWEDRNGNGVQDAGEPGLCDVSVYLLDAGGKHIFDGQDGPVMVKTDLTGHYRFRDLPSGTYRLKFVLPPGYTFTQPRVGDDNTIDSDVDPTDGTTAAYALAPGQMVATADAGMRATGGTANAEDLEKRLAAEGAVPGLGDLTEATSYWAGYQPSDFWNGLSGASATASSSGGSSGGTSGLGLGFSGNDALPWTGGGGGFGGGGAYSSDSTDTTDGDSDNGNGGNGGGGGGGGGGDNNVVPEPGSLAAWTGLFAASFANIVWRRWKRKAHVDGFPDTSVKS